MPDVKNEVQDRIIIGTEIFVPMLKEEEIQNRIRELGKQITIDYAGKVPVFIGVLNGAFLFLSDLIKNISIECEVDFFKLKFSELFKVFICKILL